MVSILTHLRAGRPEVEIAIVNVVGLGHVCLLGLGDIFFYHRIEANQLVALV